MVDPIWNPLDLATIADPFPTFKHLRESHPVYWHEDLKSWVVTRHIDCQEVLRNHSVFARDRRRAGGRIPDDRLNIQTQDPPEQAELRQIVMRTLHSQNLSHVSRIARKQLESLMTERNGTGDFDMMREVARPIAIDLINSVVGVKTFDSVSYRPIFEGLTKTMDGGLDPSRIPAGVVAGDELRRAVAEWFADPDADGMIGDLRSNLSVSEMASSYVENTMAGVFNAGFSTLSASIGSIMLVLLERPKVLDALEDPSLLASGVHELLRFTSPAQATSRVAIAGTTLSGQKIKSGETVITLMAAANRDPEVFEKPDDIVLDRNPNPHLAFAWGPHVCLGAQLATIWVSELVKFLLEHRGEIQLTGQPVYMNSATLRNIEYLPISFTRELARAN